MTLGRSSRGRDYISALSPSDKRRYLSANIGGSVALVLLIVGRALAFPDKHGVAHGVGLLLLGVGAVAIVLALSICSRLALRGRKTVRATQEVAVPQIRSDPTRSVGELTPNGEELWNGTAWVSATSADGTMRWSGTQWVPRS